MEYEKVFNILPETLRVLLRNTQLRTNVMVEVDGRYVIDLGVDNWTELLKSISTIDREFYRRLNTKQGVSSIEYEMPMIISNTLRVLLRNINVDTFVMIEVDGKFVVSLDAKQWVNFKNHIPKIEQEFYKRFNYQYVENAVLPEEEEGSGAEKAD